MFCQTFSSNIRCVLFLHYPFMRLVKQIANVVMEFLKNNNLIRHVSGTNKNWTALAEGYNGKGQQGYDTKLEKAYARFSKITL